MAIRPARTIFGLLLTGALAAALTYAFWPRPIEVDVVEIGRGPMVVSVVEDGKTRLRERYIVSAPLRGQLRRIELRPGDPVERGKTVLTAIEPQSPDMLDARESARALAREKAAGSAVKRSENTLNAAEAALTYAKAEVLRARAVARERVISQSELDNIEMLYRTRQEELEAARFAAEIANFEHEQAKAVLQFTAFSESQQGLDLEIRAPIDGQVVRVLQESSIVVAPGTPLIELGDPRDLEVEVDVLSRDAVRIRPGARAWLEHWGGEEPLAARVRTVEPSGFTKISALGVEEQRVNVILDLVDPPEQRRELGDGFRVEARIVIWEGDEILKAPVSALFRAERDWASFVVEGSIARLRRVETGRRGGYDVEIVHGLEPGDVVIVHPSEKLRDGDRVAISYESSPTLVNDPRGQMYR